MSETIMPDYVLDYEAFMNSFKKTEVSGEEVGELVMRMSGYFARYNMRLGDALRAYTQTLAKFQLMNDVNGKQLSSAKAESMAKATEEAAEYELAKIHVQNLENYINSLKSLQKGILQEYAHSAA